MIAFQRTISVMPGMFSAAMAYANELKAQVKATAGLDMKIAVPVSGNPSRIAWLSTHENLAEFDTLTKKLLTDQKYQELLKKGAGIVVPDTQFDEIWFTL
jgi:hypothetical protein